MDKNEYTLKLITLNIWGGHIEQPLLQFFHDSQAVDVFCLQEVYHQAPMMITNEDRFVSLDIFSKIQEAIPQHQGYFRPVIRGIYGIAMFIKKDWHVLDEGEMTIYQNDHYPGIGPTHSRILQHAKIQRYNTTYNIINVHGLWNGMGKKDSPERILQSKAIRNFIDATQGPIVLCGDFNLRPGTQSLGIIAAYMQDHIKINSTTSTRTSLYPGEERFADYIFSSQDITAYNFQVLPIEVSDHAPLFIQCNIKGNAYED